MNMAKPQILVRLMAFYPWPGPLQVRLFYFRIAVAILIAKCDISLPFLLLGSLLTVRKYDASE